ncbi:hypothetical protein K438DRAFT_1991975 [Mycena galopus ATCC 62051]|nr:hypothetical protein K438DRAFT_1991975 [Mycena galopus ATCC 62051]
MYERRPAPPPPPPPIRTNAGALPWDSNPPPPPPSPQPARALHVGLARCTNLTTLPATKSDSVRQGAVKRVVDDTEPTTILLFRPTRVPRQSDSVFDMTTYPQYQIFQVYEEDSDYVFKNIIHSDDQSEFLYVLSVYRSTRWQTVDDAIDDGHRYLYLGKAYNNCYMQVKDFGERLGLNTLSDDYNKLKGGIQDLFPIWDSHGKTTPLPRNFFVASVEGMTLEKWSEAQRKPWTKVIHSTGEAIRPTPYSVLARLMQPAAFPGFELVFSPTELEEHVTKTELETYVEEAMDAPGAPKYQYRVYFPFANKYIQIMGPLFPQTRSSLVCGINARL